MRRRQKPNKANQIKNLCRAVKNGQLEKVKKILERMLETGFDINSQITFNNQKTTLFALAIKTIGEKISNDDRHKIARYLLEKKVNPDIEINCFPLLFYLIKRLDWIGLPLCKFIISKLDKKVINRKLKMPILINLCYNLKELQKNDTEQLILVMLDAGADSQIVDYQDNTPLHIIAENGARKNVVKAIIKAGAQVNAKNKVGWTPVHAAAASNQVDIMKILLYHGGNLKIFDNKGVTPESIITYSGNQEMIELLRPANVQELFHTAMANSNWPCDTIETYLKLGADFNVPIIRDGNIKMMPLEAAIIMDRTERVNILLQFGADLTNLCYFSCSQEIEELIGANGFDKILKLFIDKGIINHPWKIYKSALINGQLSIIKLLLIENKELLLKDAEISSHNISIASILQNTLLAALLKKYHSSIVKFCLENGADPHQTVNDDSQYTPFKIAIWLDDIQGIDLMLKFTCKNKLINQADTFLKMAIFYLQSNLLLAILKAGWNVNTKIENYHLLRLAAARYILLLKEKNSDNDKFKRADKIIEILIENNADLSQAKDFITVSETRSNDLLVKKKTAEEKLTHTYTTLFTKLQTHSSHNYLIKILEVSPQILKQWRDENAQRHKKIEQLAASINNTEKNVDQASWFNSALTLKLPEVKNLGLRCYLYLDKKTIAATKEGEEFLTKVDVDSLTFEHKYIKKLTGEVTKINVKITANKITYTANLSHEIKVHGTERVYLFSINPKAADNKDFVTNEQATLYVGFLFDPRGLHAEADKTRLLKSLKQKKAKESSYEINLPEPEASSEAYIRL